MSNLRLNLQLLLFTLDKKGVTVDDAEEEESIESNLLNDCASDPRKTFRVNG